MRSRRIAALLGAVALVSIGQFALGPAVQAVVPMPMPSTTWQVYVDCSHDVYLPGSPGDMYDFTFAADCGWADGDSVLANDYPLGLYVGVGFLDVPANYDTFTYRGYCWFIYDTQGYPTCDRGTTDWWVELQPGPTQALGVRLLAVNQLGSGLRVGPVGSVYDSRDDRLWLILWGVQRPAASPWWQQAYGRASADAACDAGWTPSWQQWPHDGAGGWVCVRDVLMYGG
jgi:hypothetical protein